MMMPARTTVFALALLAAPTSAAGESVDELLPPPARQAEKRSLGPGDLFRRAHYDGRGTGTAAFSHDGKLLVIQGMLWDVASGRSREQLGQLMNHGESQSPAFTPDGKQLITATWGGHGQGGFPVTVWDVAKRQRLRSLDEDANDTPFTAAAVAPDGKTIALGAGWGRRTTSLNIVFLDLATGDEVRQISGLVKVDPMRGQGAPVYHALAYSPDGRTLAVLTEGRVLLVELATGKQRGEMAFTPTVDQQPQRRGFQLGSLAYAPDGRTLAAGCPDGAIRRFDLRTSRELAPVSGHAEAVIGLHWSADGKRMLSYSQDGQLYSWRTGGSEWKPKSGVLTDEALDGLWEVLRGDDARDLFGCVQALVVSPAQSLPFLKKRLAPVPKADEERINRLVAEIQSGDYNARKRALVQLRKIGAPAAPALRRSQERGYDELLRKLMFEFDNLAPPAEQVRAVRAVQVLEQIGNADSAKLLKALSEGATGARLTIQAKAAVARLEKAGSAAKEEPTSAALWEALAGEDSAAAYRAVQLLAARPSATMLRDRMKEAVSKDLFNDEPKRLAKLIGDLDSDNFPVREEACKSLRELGPLAVAAMGKTLEGKVSLEVKRRLEKLLAEAAQAPPEILRIGRALEALELMGNAEGREALEALKDVRAAWLRQAAGDSLRRHRE